MAGRDRDDADTLSAFDDGLDSEAPAPAGAFLVVALVADHPTEPPARYALSGVDMVELGRGTSRQATRRSEAGRRVVALRLPDRRMSSEHARLARLGGRWIIDDAGSKNGTTVNGAAVAHAELSDGDLIEVGHTFVVFRDDVELPTGQSGDLDGAVAATLVPRFAQQLGSLAQVARSDVPVVLFGESGTGKEVMARSLHDQSGRPGAFVAVNCGALPDNLVETELFGYRKGAFSGAAEDRPGLIRSADKGTLFLDEIGDLPAGSQAPLLRVLQEREVMPVGGTRPIPVDLRVVAATHRDLPVLVEEGKFRSDLWARLSGYAAELPPLRERREDLGLLCAALLRKRIGAGADQTSFTPRAARALFFHDWPLNVRELEQCLASALVLAGAGPIGFEHLPPVVQGALAKPRPAATDGESPLTEKDEQLRDRIIALLKEHQGNVAAVARDMGKARMQIHRWMRRFKILPGAFRD